MNKYTLSELFWVFFFSFQNSEGTIGPGPRDGAPRWARLRDLGPPLARAARNIPSLRDARRQITSAAKTVVLLIHTSGNL